MEPAKKSNGFLILLFLVLLVVLFGLLLKNKTTKPAQESQEPIVTETPITEEDGVPVPPETIDRPSFGSTDQ